MFTRARFNSEYVPGMFSLMIDAYKNKRHASMWKDLVTVKTSSKKREWNAIRSGVGTPRLKGEGAPVTYDTPIGGPEKYWVHHVDALAVRITEEAIEDNLYELGNGGGDDLKELAKDLGIAMEDNLETTIAQFLNSATATTYHKTRFSKALAATDHPRLDGSTYSNKATSTDLTYSTFWTNLVAAENQYDHRQKRIRKMVNSLWVPPQMEKQGLEVLKSTDRPDTANRAVSAYAQSGRKIQLKVWPYMTDTDMWVMKLDGQGIIFFWRRKTRFAREKEFQTGDMMIKADQRFSAEINDEQCFYCNVPA